MPSLIFRFTSDDDDYCYEYYIMNNSVSYTEHFFQSASFLHGTFWPKTCQCPHVENNTRMYNLGGWNALVQSSEFDYLWLFVEERGIRVHHTIVVLILHTVWLFLTISDKACARLWLLVTKCAQFGGLAKTWSRITAKHRLLFPCQRTIAIIIIVSFKNFR